MEYRILGPLAAFEGGRELPLGGAKQRALLALLLLRANEVVPTPVLVDELWGDRAPATAVKTVQVYVSQLRKTLGPDAVETRAPGYLLPVAPGALDLDGFTAGLEEGRRLLRAGDAPGARAALDAALALWHGPALAEFRYEPFAQAGIARLEELRLAAVELRLEACVELGGHVDAVPELEALVREHPLRESLRRLLMLALYRSGRQAEALSAYQEARAALVDELGLEPSQALQQLERAILVQDPALEAPAASPPSAVAPSEPIAPPRAAALRRREPPPAVECPACGAENTAGSRFCASCGAPLAIDLPVGSRKVVTVLFCDVVASTELGERLDPESMRSLMGRFFDEAGAVLERHGGSVEQFMGDGVMAVFGVPVVREDDALRAVRAAVELAAAVRERLPALQVRVGVESGEVVAGDPDDAQGAVTGDAVVVAKRLEEVAPPGQVLLGVETYTLVAHAVEGELLEAVVLKGRSDAHIPFRVDAVDADAPAFPRRDDAPLVGRRLELARLRGVFDHVAAGLGTQLVTICGDAGIGKSRLVRELLAEIEGQATVLIGRCPPYGEGVTFLPLRDLLRHAGRDEADLGATSHEIFAATRAVVEELARDRPVVAAFEDVHWAEETFLDLLEYLQGRLGAARVLLVCLARPELADRRPGLLHEPATSIGLKPLSPVESEQLLDELGSPPDARRRIADAAEGNPLFVEQLAALAEEQQSLPASIRGVIAERLDRLPREARAVLERGAVAGRSFTVEQAIALCPAELGDQVHPRLLGLVRARLLRPDPELADGFRFQHALIRDVAYDGIPKSVRADLHECMADLVEDDAVVGHHLEQAYRYRRDLGETGNVVYALAARAGQLLARAGSDAVRRADVPGAIALFERATALLPQDDPSLPLLLIELGYARIQATDFARADETLAGALDAARRLGDRPAELRATLEREFLRPYVTPGDDYDGPAVAEELMPELEKLGDQLGLAKAWWLKSQADMVACRWQARAEALERALEHAQRVPEARDERREITANLARALYRSPTPVPTAIARCEELLETAAADRVLRADLMTTLAGLNAMRGDAERAAAQYADAIAVHEELGLRFRRLVRAEIGASIKALAGDAAGAEAELRMACEALEAAGERGVHSTLSAVLANLLAAQGRDAEAAEFARDAAAAADEADIGTQVLWRSALAMVLAREGKSAEASDLAADACSRARATDFPQIKVAAFVAGAEAAAAAGQGEHARKLLVEAHAVCEAKGDVVAATALAARLVEAAFPPDAVAH